MEVSEGRDEGRRGAIRGGGEGSEVEGRDQRWRGAIRGKGSDQRWRGATRGGGAAAGPSPLPAMRSVSTPAARPATQFAGDRLLLLKGQGRRETAWAPPSPPPRPIRGGGERSEAEGRSEVEARDQRWRGAISLAEVEASDQRWRQEITCGGERRGEEGSKQRWRGAIRGGGSDQR